MERLPRFRRAPDIAPFVLTERDFTILRQVLRHRFLRTAHLVQLVPGSAQQVRRRLQLLYHHGYLERPRCQIDYYHRGGSRQMAYGLGNRGFALLKERLQLPHHRLDWDGRRAAVGRLFLEHALQTADFLVRMELACRDNLWLRYVPGEDVALPEATRAHRQPWHWQVPLKRGEKLGLVPDGVFALEWLHPTDAQKHTLCFVELDRGTMPVTRKDFRRSSFFRKLLAYQQSWEQGILQRRFGAHRFRVLTVTSSAERRDHLRQACEGLGTGRGLFLFTDQATLAATPQPLQLPWLNADNGVELLG